MTGPIYVAQTFEPEHVTNQAAMTVWFKMRIGEATARDATWFRYSYTENGDGLLIEAWVKQPVDQGEQRWEFAVQRDDHV